MLHLFFHWGKNCEKFKGRNILYNSKKNLEIWLKIVRRHRQSYRLTQGRIHLAIESAYADKKTTLFLYILGVQVILVIFIAPPPTIQDSRDNTICFKLGFYIYWQISLKIKLFAKSYSVIFDSRKIASKYRLSIYNISTCGHIIIGTCNF